MNELMDEYMNGIGWMNEWMNGLVEYSCSSFLTGTGTWHGWMDEWMNALIEN